MLILAGVSLNAVIGDNGIITMAQLSNIESRFAKYKEEMEMNLVSKIGDETIENESQVTVLNGSVKKYIPSLEEDDVGQFGIIAGKLYYIGDNELSMKAAKSQNIEIKPNDKDLENFINDVEKTSIENVVKEMGENLLKNAIDTEDEEKKGIKLENKAVGKNEWAIITELNGDEIVATYGTGWYFVKKGTELENIGILNNDYIINYETSKAILFNGYIHTILSNSDSVAVKGGLILNIDPSSIENKNTSSFRRWCRITWI